MNKRSAISHQPLANRRPLAASRVLRLRAFTLTELMIAVVVLIVVIIATSKIFGTASKVTGIGQATASMMTEAAAIERQMRDDIAKLTPEGFFAIRCVAIRNDYYRNPPPPGAHAQQIHVPDPGAPLLNANLPPSAYIRADQLVFFANGVTSMQTFRPSAELFARAQNLTSRIYYGHAFQLRNALPAEVVHFNSQGDPDGMNAYDPVAFQPGSTPFYPPTPWHRTTGGVTNIVIQRNEYGTFGGLGTTGAGNDMFGPTGASININGSQPEARQWLLARQAVVLIDDDQHDTEWNLNYKTIWPDDGIEPHVTARSIFIQPGNGLPWGYSREIRNGRLDSAASQLEDIRTWVLYNRADHMPSAPMGLERRPWIGGAPNTDQRSIIRGAVYYPRAERRAPGPNRVDQALTNPVIGSACGSLTIDWTYDEGAGAVYDASGNFKYATGADLTPNTADDYPLVGVWIDPASEQPWFGLDEVNPASAFPAWPMGPGKRGVSTYAALSPANTVNVAFAAAETILPINTFPNNIESQLVSSTTLLDYWAVFGYNQSQAVDPSTGNPWLAVPPVQTAFTPFPSAIRVTMTLHDPEGKLEGGREFQFVIRLPKRTP